MLVKVTTLEGKTYELTLEDDITVNKIRQKLLSEHNLNTDRCYFCRNGRILENETIPKESFAPEEPIILFNYQTFPDKSFPKVDSAFQISFSRYSDTYINHKPINANAQSDVSSIDQLISLGILPPNDSLSRAIRIVRNTHRNINSRNNNNSNHSNSYFSDSDDDDERAHREQPIQHTELITRGNINGNITIGLGLERPIQILNGPTGARRTVLIPMENTEFMPFDHDQDTDFENPFSNHANGVIGFRLNTRNRNQPMEASRILLGINTEPALAHTQIPPMPQQQLQLSHMDQMPIPDIEFEQFDQPFETFENIHEMVTNSDNFDQTNEAEQVNNRLAHLENQFNQLTNAMNRPPPAQQNSTTAAITTTAQANNLPQQQRQQPPPRQQNRPPRSAMSAMLDNARRENELNLQIIEALNLNIQLSEEDNRAISRLVHSGYDRATVIQVFEACDRNEENALNLLVAMG